MVELKFGINNIKNLIYPAWWSNGVADILTTSPLYSNGFHSHQIPIQSSIFRMYGMRERHHHGCPANKSTAPTVRPKSDEECTQHLFKSAYELIKLYNIEAFSEGTRRDKPILA